MSNRKTEEQLDQINASLQKIEWQLIKANRSLDVLEIAAFFALVAALLATVVWSI
jgi:hypothetical protein